MPIRGGGKFVRPPDGTGGASAAGREIVEQANKAARKTPLSAVQVVLVLLLVLVLETPPPFEDQDEDEGREVGMAVPDRLLRPGVLV
jgi:hypothetical protein